MNLETEDLEELINNKKEKMIILIAGASHTGKTLLAQKLLEKYKYPYLSIDHLKMGLIRSGNTTLTPESDDNDLTAYLWPIVREIIKTNIENKQNLIIEGCYIPFDWKNDFEKVYLNKLKYICLIMSEQYIKTHYFDIKSNENVIENRIFDNISQEELIKENSYNLKMCKKYGNRYILINDKYQVETQLLLKFFC